MGLLNPVHALVIPTLCLVTVPLAVLAGITTTLAFAVLLLRVFVVYLDMALSLMPQSVFGLASRSIATTAAAGSSSPLASSPSPPRRQQQQQQQQQQLQRHPPRRRTSSGSAVSAGSASSLSERGLGLIPSVGAERDFEGVGGWRVGGAEDDELWATVSPRLDMPERSLSARPPPQHHHLRTPSGEWGGGYLMMKGRARSAEGAAGTGAGAGGGPAARTSPTSPNCSRARVPTPGAMFALTGASGGPVDGYFALSRNTSPRATKRY